MVNDWKLMSKLHSLALSVARLRSFHSPLKACNKRAGLTPGVLDTPSKPGRRRESYALYKEQETERGIERVSE